MSCRSSNSDDPEMLEAIEEIYACATDSARFDDLPARLAPVLDASAVNLWCFTSDLQSVSIANYGLTDKQLSDYLENWIHADPLVESTLSSGTGLGAASVPESQFGERGYRDLAVVEGFYRPNDIERQMARFDQIDPGWMVAVTAQRSEQRSQISNVDLRRLDLLSHHLRRAWQIAIRTGLFALEAAAADAILARCRLATWILDPALRILGQNEQAHRLLRDRNTGVSCTANRLRFIDPALDSALQAALSAVESDARMPVEIPLGGGAEGRYSWGMVIPLERERDALVGMERTFMLVLARPGDESAIRWEQLQSRLSLTEAEAMVLARLMCGEGLAEIADRRGSAYETVRSHEKALRARLDCPSRSALLARGWWAIATIPDLASPDTDS